MDMSKNLSINFIYHTNLLGSFDRMVVNGVDIQLLYIYTLFILVKSQTDKYMGNRVDMILTQSQLFFFI